MEVGSDKRTCVGYFTNRGGIRDEKCTYISRFSRNEEHDKIGYDAYRCEEEPYKAKTIQRQQVPVTLNRGQ